jgi:excisionase family DNA binding protein
MDTTTPSRTILPISEAAERLGVSVETLRKRLQRGRLEGFKAQDGTWRVVVEATTRVSEDDEADALHADIDELRGDVRTLAQAVEKLADQLVAIRSQSARAESLLEAIANKLAMLTSRDRPQPVTKQDIDPLIGALSGLLEHLERRR